MHHAAPRPAARLAQTRIRRERMAEHNRTTAPAQPWRHVLRTVEHTYTRAGTLAT